MADECEAVHTVEKFSKRKGDIAARSSRSFAPPREPFGRASRPANLFASPVYGFGEAVLHHDEPSEHFTRTSRRFPKCEIMRQVRDYVADCRIQDVELPLFQKVSVQMRRAQDLFDRLVAGGEAEVLAFIAEPVTEELFLDYKRSADNGTGTALHNRDKANLSKGISGFGNSEGGVILWGVDCRNDPSLGDVPSGPVHIQNPARFKSWLEQATTGLTVPPHEGVRHHAISEGFVVTLIPSGMHAPYQTVGDLSYYIRSGSNFAKTPHAVLAGLFGRRPQPIIKHHFFIPSTPSIIEPGVAMTQIGIMLRNYGRGIAEDVFINLSIRTHPGRCEILFKPSEEKRTVVG